MRARVESEPFRFLDLPKEIRLMVYERLPRNIKHHQFRHPDEPSHRVTFVLRSVPVALLATCWQIHHEALPFVEVMKRRFILESPPRVVDGVSGRGEGRMLDAVIRAAMKQYDVLIHYSIGQGPCLSISQLFEGRLRNSLESKRNSRFLAKFVHQAAHQLKYGCTQEHICSRHRVNGLRSIEIVKYTSEISGIGRHWALGADLHALNQRLHRKGIAVVCAGTLPAGLSEPSCRASGTLLVPQYVNFQSYGLGCYVPSVGQMKEQIWRDDWLE